MESISDRAKNTFKSNIFVDPMDDGICRCAICGRKPDEIQEYIDCAKDEDMTPEEYVRTDGTYNHRTKKFYCSSCYIKIGMPLGTA